MCTLHRTMLREPAILICFCTCFLLMLRMQHNGCQSCHGNHHIDVNTYKHDNRYAKAMQSGSKRCNNHQMWKIFSFHLTSSHFLSFPPPFPSFSFISPHFFSFFLFCFIALFGLHSPLVFGHITSLIFPFIPFFRGLSDTETPDMEMSQACFLITAAFVLDIRCGQLHLCRFNFSAL